MTENHRFVWPNYLPNSGVRVLTNSLTKSDCDRYITSHRDSKVESARSMLAVASGCTETCYAFHKTPQDIGAERETQRFYAGYQQRDAHKMNNMANGPLRTANLFTAWGSQRNIEEKSGLKFRAALVVTLGQ